MIYSIVDHFIYGAGIFMWLCIIFGVLHEALISPREQLKWRTQQLNDMEKEIVELRSKLAKKKKKS